MTPGISAKDGTLTFAAFAQIDAVCDQYESDWSHESQPRVEAYLRSDWPVVQQRALLRDLLILELDRRLARGEAPVAADYYRRFPGSDDLVDEAFFAQGSCLGTEVPRVHRGESQTVLPMRQIQSLCEEFDRQSACDEQAPDWSPWLDQAGREARDILLRNLLQIELHRRRALGDDPSAAEYIDRFPDDAQLIHHEFGISTHVPLDTDHTATEAHPSRHQLPRPTVTRLGDFFLERELGRGAMGVVFAARHVQHGTRVALKTLPTVEGASLHRFKQEFRTLADINHPQLVGLQTLEAAGGQWFFTMDLVEGDDFLNHVRPGGSLNEHRLRDALAQLVRGVHALHEHQIIHRDLKPSNVMVSTNGRLQLLDFGVVLNLSRFTPGLTDAELAGTPAYMAPEQFELATSSPASDWYSVGVMLYQAMQGTRPFGGTLHQMIAAKQTEVPPPLADNLPEDLRRLCMRLLRRDPNARPSGAELLVIASGESKPAADIPHVSPIIGRQRQLQQLEEFVARCLASRRPAVAFVQGRSGEGKTFLCDQLLRRFRMDSQFTVLEGRCYDRESLPFKALDTLVDALSSRLKEMSDQEVRALLTEDASILAQLFPVLDRVPAIAQLRRVSLENLELDRVRQLAAKGLRAILRRLSAQTPIIFFIDDLQWGDTDSAELLLQVLQSDEPPHLLVIGTFRSDEAENSGFLRRWDEHHSRIKRFDQLDCEVGQLTEAECVQLVTQLVGVENAAVAQRATQMAEETKGNAFLMSELARHYDPARDDQKPIHIDELLSRKLAALPADAELLLHVVAVSSRALAADEVSQTAGHVVVPMSTISRMKSERLVRLVETGDELAIDTYHDKIRDSILQGLDAERRAELHRQLGTQIEAKVGSEAVVPEEDAPLSSRVYDLAYHFFEAGDARAFAYQMQAGLASQRAFAPENAIAHVERAQACLPRQAGQGTQYKLWKLRGDACGRTERVQEALEAYENATSLARTPLERAVVSNGVGEMHRRCGEIQLSVAAFNDALNEIGYGRPNSWIGTLFQLPFLRRQRSCDGSFPAREHNKAAIRRRSPRKSFIGSHTITPLSRTS